MNPSPWRLPEFSLRFLAIWRRNFLVWRKLAIPSLLGNLADPLLYVVGARCRCGSSGSRSR